MIMFNGIHLVICFGCIGVGFLFGYLYRWATELDREEALEAERAEKEEGFYS